MTKPISVTAKKPISVFKKSIKINYKEAGISITKAGFDLFTSNWSELGDDAIDIAASLGISRNSEEEIAWVLIYSSLIDAIKTIAVEENNDKSKQFNLVTLNTSLLNVLDKNEIVINTSFFRRPDKNELFNIIEAPLEKWLMGSGLTAAEAASIIARVPAYFAYSLQREWSKKPGLYAPIKQTLDTPFTQANERVLGWYKYYTWLRKQIDQPLFMETFSLKQVYVPLRGFFLHKPNSHSSISSGEVDRVDNRLVREIVDMEQHIKHWVKKADKDDAILLISGGPGSGKSSFAKILAAKLADVDEIKVLFIPLHHFEPSEDLIDGINKYIEIDGFLAFNPVLGEHKEDRLLIIFDGLDELAMQGKISEITVRNFIREVLRKSERLNDQKLCIQIIITGRELVIQENESSFRKEGQILNLLPYFVNQNFSYGYKDFDPKKLLEIDQRHEWWEKYGKASNTSYVGLPSELSISALEEITSQPLLNYLVALSLKRGNIDITADTNLNNIYADLLKAIYERGWAGHQHASIDGIDEKDFIRILEEIAIAAWHGNGRTTTVKEIEEHCTTSGLKTLLNKFKSGISGDSSAKVTQLLTAFYFRKNGIDNNGDNTFEFTHKSFGEYLTAKRIVREIRLINRKLSQRFDDPDDGWDERDALLKWAQVFGPSTLDTYILDFLNNELRLIATEELVNIEPFQKDLCKLAEIVVRSGMPIERISPRPNYLEELKISRNAEEALLVVLNACAESTQKISTIDWPLANSFGTWIKKMLGQRLAWESSLLLSKLSFLDLTNSWISTNDFWYSSFYKSKLDNVTFVSSDCRYSAFDYSSGVETIFTFANLSGSTFAHADYELAKFEECKLHGANFRNARLVGCSFDRSLLIGVNFKGANLEGATFNGAYIQACNFDDANLSGTSFAKANIDGNPINGLDYKSQKITTHRLNLIESDSLLSYELRSGIQEIPDVGT